MSEETAVLTAYTHKTEPLGHQAEDFAKTRDLQYWAWYWEMGTGKSKMVIDTAAYLHQQGKIDLCLIIAPKGSYLNWMGEVDKHCPVAAEAAYWSASASTAVEDWFYQVKEQGPKLKFIAVNVEALSSPRGEGVVRTILTFHRCLLVVDESTAIKSPQATRARAAVKLRDMPNCVARRVLSGTPSPQSPLDLYMQLEFLNKGLSGFNTFATFRSYYAIQQTRRFGARSFNEITGYRNLERIQGVLAGCSSRYTKKDCLDLPDKIYEVREVTMHEEQIKHYQAIKKEAMVLLEDKLMTATSAITALAKLRQVVSGFLKMDDGTIIRIKNNRIKELAEGIEEMPHTVGVIVWCAFREDVRAVSEYLREQHGQDSVVTYLGGIKDTERIEAIDAFQKSQTARFFVATAQSGGVGNTLTRCTYMVYFSNGFDGEKRWQSEDRAHRIGQTESLTIVDLVARGTVDEKIIAALKSKEDLQALVLQKPVELLRRLLE